MRLRRLTFRGIGPFAGEENIDFDRMSSSSIYLLEGPTGSGKSTIIDAICYALYGKIAGGKDSSVERLRSTFANPKKPSFVDLIFTVESGTYRVRREPEYIKEGNANPSRATAKLMKISDDSVKTGSDKGEPLASLPRDVGPAIIKLIGLNAEQFLQTVILPQGKFSEFLALNTQDRTALLSKIFNTGLYGKLTSQLQELAKQSRADIEAKKTAIEKFTYALASDLNLAPEEQEELSEKAKNLTLPENIDELNDTIAHHVEKLVEEHHRAQLVADGAETHARQKEEKFKHAQELTNLLAQRSKLRETRAELEKQQPEIDKKREQLRLHTLTLPLMPLVEQFTKTRDNLNLAKEGYEKLCQDNATLADKTYSSIRFLPTISADSLASQHLSTAHQLSDTLRKESGKLEELRNAEHALQVLKNDHRVALQHAENVAKKLEVAKTEEKQLHEKICEAEHVKKKLEPILLEIPRITAGLNEWEQRLEDYRTADALEKSFNQARQEYDTAKKKLTSSQQNHQLLTQQWLASISAEIAETLEDSLPCPVCGSVEHPQPARATETHVTRNEVEDAEKKLSAVRVQVEKITGAYTQARTRWEEKKNSIKGYSEEQISTELARYTKLSEQAQTQEEELRECEKLLENLYKEHEECATAHQTLREEQSRRGATQQQLALNIQAEEQRLSQECGGFDSLEERQKFHEDNLGILDSWIEAATQLLEAGQLAGQAQEKLNVAIKKEPIFASAKDIQDSHVSKETESILEKECAEFTRMWHEVERDLAEPAIAQLTGEEQPRLKENEQAVREAQEEVRKARAVATRQETLLAQARKHHTQVETAEKAWLDSVREAGPSLRLAALATAGVESKTNIPLETYVLQQRFERIIDVANERLLTISNGVYQLMRTNDKDKGSRQTKIGLGLKVREWREGKESLRETASLSGGETFFVALALALALADVVRAENGGIHLETLLIDEGFGSLSSDKLHNVMDVLHGLTEHKRSVGVISHVADMKEAISEKISIRRLPDGTSTLRASYEN
ncbi:AAA family ATPase [Actinotignum urinale]|uniref:AAA family ATPase n=1 Tax=Actinotignum urinale TaxID=190146 RepID=UPI0003B46AC5|nr:SMC family ATPase [Actinotignum urinale]MDY5161066.1 SMC family ATPase [Actinotignum urinale]